MGRLPDETDLMPYADIPFERFDCPTERLSKDGESTRAMADSRAARALIDKRVLSFRLNDFARTPAIITINIIY